MPVLVYVIRFNYYGGEIDYCVYLRVMCNPTKPTANKKPTIDRLKNENKFIFLRQTKKEMVFFLTQPL